jgi:hypothetical protein
MERKGWNEATNAAALGWFERKMRGACASTPAAARFRRRKYNGMCEKKFCVAGGRS